MVVSEMGEQWSPQTAPAQQAEMPTIMRVMKLRSDVLKALELARGEKLIGKPLDAEVTVYLGSALKAEALAPYDLKSICIVSGVTLVEGEAEGLEKGAVCGVQVAVKASDKPKCARCWIHDEGVGADPDHPDLCPRCAGVVK